MIESTLFTTRDRVLIQEVPRSLEKTTATPIWLYRRFRQIIAQLL